MNLQSISLVFKNTKIFAEKRTIRTTTHLPWYRGTRKPRHTPGRQSQNIRTHTQQARGEDVNAATRTHL